MFGTDGKIVGMMQRAHDVSREVAAERTRDAISIEYDHRVRNLLSKVSAIARRTARSAGSMQQFIADFDPRMNSMARAHQLLAEGTWDRIDLVDLVNAELAPYTTSGSAGQDAIYVNGPAVILSSRIAQALGMALHELATNAAKHGALSRAGGRLDVHWSLDALTGAVDLHWNEANAAMIARPRSSGFGSIIIDRILPSEVGGNVTRDFTPRGLVCNITIPAPDKA